MLKSVAWLGVTAFVATSFTPDGVLLRRKLEEGQKDVYRVEMRMQQNATMEGSMFGNIPSDIPLDMGGSMKMILQTGKLSEDKKEVELEIEFAEPQWTFEAMGQVQQIPPDAMGTQKVLGRLDERNRLNLTGFPGLPAEFAGLARSFGGGALNINQLLFVEFPEKEINVGDSWDVKIPANPLTGNKEVILKARLTGEREEANKPVYEITMEGTIPINMDFKQLASAIPALQAQGLDIKMFMKGTMKVEVNALVEKETGRTVYLKNTTTNEQVIEIPDYEMKMSLKGTILAITRLLQETP
jgi:hypothetical protein